MTGDVQPGYIALYRSGELERRAEELESRLERCDICPRECGVDRLADQRKVCRTGRRAVVASVCDHHGEEPALSGAGGSGTVFFGHCNLRCVYCQNHQISQGDAGFEELGPRELAAHFLRLQRLGCHNINLVTPSHVVPQVVRAVLEAVPLGLRLPLVYNTSSYDSLRTLKALDGIVDIYLADLRYGSDEWGLKLSGVPDYVERSREAIMEMYRQVGNLVVDGWGVALKGLIVRHLILPNGLAGSEDSLTWLARQVSPEVTVSIMSQYFPAHHARRIPELSRGIGREEYEKVVGLAGALGLENGWIQELSASHHYLPDFERDGHPFESAVG